MSIGRQVILGSLLVVLVTSRLWAADPSRRISQYAHTAWRIQDGFFGALPRAITQTADGYLWIGTENGLLRFDGVRFVPWTPPAGTQLPSPTVVSLLGGRDGSLWIGTIAGLSRWKDGRLVTYPGHAWITAIIEDRGGRVWITRFPFQTPVDGALCQIAGDGLRCYGEADGLPLPSANSVVEDGDGGLWIGSDMALARWSHGSFTLSSPGGPAYRLGFRGAVAAVPTRDRALWVGSRTDGIGLVQLDQGVPKPFVTPEIDGRAQRVNALLLDREQALWVGTFQGLLRIHGGTVDRFVAADGLSSDLVHGLYEDREGNLWTATSKGIDCFRNLRVATFSAREGFIPGDVDSLLVSGDGTLWIGGAAGLNAIRDGRARAIRNDGRQVTTLFEDHAGRLWVGVDDTLTFYEQGRFTTVTRRDGSPIGSVTGLTEDPDHNLWAEVSTTRRSLLRIAGGVVQEELPAPQPPAARKLAADPSGGIWLGLMTGDIGRYRSGTFERIDFAHPRESFVRQIAVNPDGSVLAATEFGLAAWRNGVRQILTARNGLPCDGVNAFVRDARGAIWLYMQCGLAELTSTELEKWWAKPDAVLRVRTLDAGDGVQPGLAAYHSAARTPDGRLWFANGFVVQMIDPAHLAGNVVPAPVVIEAVVADRERYPADQHLRIPPLVRDLQIDYTALSFGAPQRVRFRYYLEGRDSAWQEPGPRRQAFYSDLPPGPYRFRVRATNADGVWNEAGATLDFSILPAWHQTDGFRALAISILLLAALAGYRLRRRQLAAQFNLRLEARVSERTRIARELHDTLLQSLHGLLVHFQAATNLLPGQPNEAKHRLERVIDQAAAAITEGRDAVQDLRSSPRDPDSLAQSISVLGQALVAENGSRTVVRVHVEGTPRDLHAILHDDVYRIAAEAVRNAVRHAGARLIQVDVSYDDRELRLRVCDDGKGIDARIVEARASSGHWGLPGMRERAELIGGKLEVLSRLGSGTEVSFSIPAAAAFGAPTHAPRWWRGQRRNPLRD